MKRIAMLIAMSLVMTIQAFAPESFRVDILLLPALKRGFVHWADDLGWRESRNNPQSINRIGCFGEHQWKESTLRSLGYDVTLKQFQANPDAFPPDVQRQALRRYMEYHRRLLQSYNHYIGKRVGGVEITESGLLAACHLGGFHSVKLFLESGGKINRRDLFGTSVRDYIKMFGGYCLEN